MKVGDLVRWDLGEHLFWLAIVVGEPFDDMGTPSTEVQWVTGKYIGERDYIFIEDLEVIG